MSNSGGARFFTIASIVGFVVDAVTVTTWFVAFARKTPASAPATPATADPAFQIPELAASIALLVLMYTFIVFLITGVRNERVSHLFIAFATALFFAAWAAIFGGFKIAGAIGLSLLWLTIYVGCVLHVVKVYEHVYRTGIFDTELGSLQKSMLTSGLLTFPIYVLFYHHIGNGPWMTAIGASLMAAFVPFAFVYPVILVGAVVLIGVYASCFVKGE